MQFLIPLLLLVFPLFSLQQEPPRILLVTIPKAGTHLVKKAIEKITEQTVHWVPMNVMARFNARLDLHSPHRITAAHLFPEIDIIRTEYSDRYIKVLMIRDPRAVMVSFMHHLIKNRRWDRNMRYDFSHFGELSADEQLHEALVFPYRNPQICFKYAALWMQDPTVFVCRFEDLVGPQGGGTREKQLMTLRNLALHIGYPLSEEKLESIASELFGGTWTFRAGQVQTWRKYYNEENKQLFKMVTGSSVKDLGYDDNW